LPLPEKVLETDFIGGLTAVYRRFIGGRED